jgi:DNA repair exonuclease SbcCD nuclease subunit
MRVLVIGDPHLKENNPSESEEMAEKISLVALKEKPDLIVCLGDVLDRHEKISLFALRRATLFLEKLSLIAKTYVLIGNHDRPNNSTYLTDEHPFLAYKHWGERLVIVDNILQEGDLLFVPYVPPGRFLESLQGVKDWQKSRVIFAHQEFSGARMGAITSSVEKWPEEAPFIISGHIHDYQRVQDNLLYVGTPIQHAFNDNQNKTISLFTFGEKSENGSPEETRIDLECKKKRIIHLKVSDLENFVLPENVSLKLVIEGEKEELRLLQSAPLIKELKSRGVKVHFKPLEKKEKFVYDRETSFYSTLQEMVKDDELQLKWMKKILEDIS